MSTSSHYKPVNPENDTCSFNRLHSNPPQHHSNPPQHHSNPPQHHSNPPQHHSNPPQHHSHVQQVAWGIPVNRCEGLEC